MTLGIGYSGLSGWTPALLGADLTLWLDASEASSITLNGSTVAQWNDKSGNNRHATQPTAASQPTYTPSGLNGKPIITFPGDGNRGFVLASGVPIPRDMTSVSQGLGYLYSANTASERIAYFGLGPNLFWSTATGSPANLPIPGRDNTSTFIEQYTAQNNNWEVLLNGSVAASGTISVSWTNNNELTQIGLKWGASTSIPSWTGIIAEIVWTNAVMSLADRQKLEGYLAWKWGLEADLPVAHPFKTIPPYA